VTEVASLTPAIPVDSGLRAASAGIPAPLVALARDAAGPGLVVRAAPAAPAAPAALTPAAVVALDVRGVPGITAPTPSSSSTECSRARARDLGVPIRQLIADIGRAEPHERVAREFRMRFARGMHAHEHRAAAHRFGVTGTVRTARAGREQARQKALDVREHARVGDFAGGRADRRFGARLHLDLVACKTDLQERVARALGLHAGIE